MVWLILSATALLFVFVRPLRLIAARDPVLTVSLFLCAGFGIFVGEALSQYGPPEFRGAWWWSPLNMLLGAFMLGPQTARWVRDMGRKS